MTKSMFRLGYTLLISGIMVAAAQPSSSAAGTKIQVTFSGSGFIGCFQYDQSQKPMPGSLRARFHIQWPNGDSPDLLPDWFVPPVCASGTPCEPFTIDTSVSNDTTFQLTGTLQTRQGSFAVLIVLPSTVSFSRGTLPFCNVGTTPAFQNTGTFTVTNATTGATIFKGKITATNCTQSTGDINCPCCYLPLSVPAPPAPAPPAPAPPPVYCVYVCPASPPTYPVYALRPRAACCLTRLFSRCSPRARCQ